MFRDRAHAAQLLSERLSHLRGQQPLVLAIPRGAVPMARSIATALEGDLDVVLVRKLGAPGNPEYAIGAIDESGTVHASEATWRHYGEDYLREEIARQSREITARRQRYTPIRPSLRIPGRTVVVVDDGSATGATMAAALRAVARQNPARLIAAMAVAPPDVATALEGLADEIVCLETPRHFSAVGQFFSDFRQVEDDEVEAALAMNATAPSPGSGE